MVAISFEDKRLTNKHVSYHPFAEYLTVHNVQL